MRRSKKNRDWLTERFVEALRPTPLLSVSDYAEAHHLLPPASAEPGPYSLARTPYAKEIMNCLDPNDPARKIVVWSGTQISKTEIILIGIDYYIVSVPCSILFASNNQTESKNMVKLRINPMIDASPLLSERIMSNRSNSRGNTVDLKEFPGGFLAIASGESAASLRSKPCRIIFLDEVDAMPNDCQGEGDPIELASRRNSTFSGREKVYVSSTCVNGNSKIIREFNSSDMRKYYVPCPFCGHMQLIDWKRFHWTAEGTNVKDVWMECANQKCKKHIKNHHKTTMLAKGKWIATNKKPINTTVAGFWLSGLYAPVGWQDWKKCVGIFLTAQAEGSQDKLTSFFNTILAEQYELTAQRPDYSLLYELSKGSGYSRGDIPDDVLVLTSGADVQEDRIECEIVGWCRNGRSRSIQYHQFLCPPGTHTSDVNNPVWSEYRDAVIDQIFIRDDGKRLRTAANAMDRGWNTAQVNAFWLKMNCDRFHLVRGENRMRSEISAAKQDKGGNAKSGKANEYRGSKYQYFDVGVSVLKAMVYRNLQIREQIDPEGKFLTDTPYLMMFPQDYNDEFFKQLTSEEYTPPKGASRYGQWMKIRDRNEALDCRVYNMAMWYKLELYRFTASDYDELEKQIASQVSIAPQQKGRSASKARVTVVSKGFKL